MILVCVCMFMYMYKRQTKKYALWLWARMILAAVEVYIENAMYTWKGSTYTWKYIQVKEIE